MASTKHKHNWANQESNRDGEKNNHSFNCGAEGPTEDPAIRQHRLRCMKNFIATLMVSQGSFMPIFPRPVSLILFIIICWTIISQFGWYKRMLAGMKAKLFNNNA